MAIFWSVIEQGSYNEESDINGSYPVDWYYNLPPEAAAAAAAYWAAVDPYYYSYYQENVLPPPPYYGYDYSYPYSYDPYYDYSYDPYMMDTEYETTPECTTPSVEEQQPMDSTKNDTEKSSSIGSLQAIRSVTDIHSVYNKEDEEETCSETDAEDERYGTPTNQSPPQQLSAREAPESDEDTDSETDEENNDSEEDEGMLTADEHVPHQLSIIFEESDAGLSDPLQERLREASVISEDDSSTTIAVESDGDIEENEEETVTVRLPLRFKFTKSEQDEDVTTVIVGDSQVLDSGSNVSVTVSIPSPPSRQSTSNSLTEQSNQLTGNDSECDSDSSDEDSSSDSDEVVSIQLPPPKSPTDEVRVSVKDRIKAIESGDSKTLSSDPEEKYTYDEDEVDSGVTSQTDTESDCFNEMRRCSYKRAATHSRLYRLLHGESDEEDDDDELPQSDSSSKVLRPISLPLTTSSRSSVPDSFPSSGIGSPASTPPRRPRSTVPTSETNSGASTPGGMSCTEPWSDYASYYSSWDERSRGYMSPTVFTAPQRTSPFPIAIPRCPMTPCPGGEGS